MTEQTKNIEYQQHITSSERECCFLHRTSSSLVNIIMQEGLGCGGGDLRGTATWQPEDLEQAELWYRQTHNGNDAIVVVKIPRSIIDNLPKKARDSLGAVKEIGYFHPDKRTYMIRPEFVVGWIDKSNDGFHPNPYDDRKPVKGFEEFAYMFD